MLPSSFFDFSDIWIRGWQVQVVARTKKGRLRGTIVGPLKSGKMSVPTVTDSLKLILELVLAEVPVEVFPRCVLSALVHTPKWAMPFWEYIRSVGIPPFRLKAEISSKYAKSLGIEKENQCLCPVAYRLFWLCIILLENRFICLFRKLHG